MEVLSKLFVGILNSISRKCMFLLVVLLILRLLLLPPFPPFDGTERSNLPPLPSSEFGIRQDKFLEVSKIQWGLNNQKISLAKACLTARMLNRTLLMPMLSPNLYLESLPISFDKVFNFDKFNTLCDGFVRLGRYSNVLNRTQVLIMRKISQSDWTKQSDLTQLRKYGRGLFDDFEVIRIVGAELFSWHDHWNVKDYVKVFECLNFIDEIAEEAKRVVSRIREVSREARDRTESMKLENSIINSDSSSLWPLPLPYVAVHMRVEDDWMSHCKTLEEFYQTNQICRSKGEIIQRVQNIEGLKKTQTQAQAPVVVVYLAVADSLLRENSSIVEDWGEGFLPLEKKKLGVDGIYEKYPYLIQSAIDYEVCLNADIFVGNSFSTFSSLLVLERTQKMIKMGAKNMCGNDVRWPSYAYNVAAGESNGPMRWNANMSDSNLYAISYGTTEFSC